MFKRHHQSQTQGCRSRAIPQELVANTNDTLKMKTHIYHNFESVKVQQLRIDFCIQRRVTLINGTAIIKSIPLLLAMKVQRKSLLESSKFSLRWIEWFSNWNSRQKNVTDFHCLKCVCNHFYECNYCSLVQMNINVASISFFFCNSLHMCQVTISINV